MIGQIAAAVRSNKPPVILEDERMTLRRCWQDGTKTIAELNIIRAVHGRMQGVKTPEQVTSELAESIKKERQKNGLE